MFTEAEKKGEVEANVIILLFSFPCCLMKEKRKEKLEANVIIMIYFYFSVH